jgi:hypothetical protein
MTRKRETLESRAGKGREHDDAGRAFWHRSARPAQRPKSQESGGEPDGYATNHVTNEESSESVPPELLEKNGRHVGTRTPDLYRVKVAL